MQEHLPDMCAHLEAMGASAILPTNAWLLELFAYRFPPHTAIRFWDWMLSAVRAKGAARGARRYNAGGGAPVLTARRVPFAPAPSAWHTGP